MQFRLLVTIEESVACKIKSFLNLIPQSCRQTIFLFTYRATLAFNNSPAYIRLLIVSSIFTPF